ncbi:hypothetical protein [Sphingobacterium sp. LRF_L2]|uniref:hypothetical protein n=1 Tax=Sphingobacterium sp. LRF_L2 TaxID=3369421 RepID=UPI003F60C177
MQFSLKKNALAFFVLVLMTNCYGQKRSLSDTILELENLDFTTPISALIPEETKDTAYVDMYNVKNTSLQRFITKENEYYDDAKPIWIEYRQFQSRSSDELAKFDDVTFNTFNMVVTLQEEMMLFNAIAEDLDKEESDAFIELLNKKYGPAEKTEGEFLNPFEIYTWKLEDRVLKYVPLYDDEHNTLKIVIDKENDTLEAGEKTPHYRGLFYVIEAKYSDKVIGNFHTGDLLYCQ